MSDDPVKECEVCGEPVRRLFFPVAIQFKGKGFYTTDYAKRSTLGAGSSCSSSGSEGGSSSERAANSEGSSSSDSAKPAASESPKPVASAAGSKSE
jgi:predicted nucleic acid-binding Zn ribbon protein